MDSDCLTRNLLPSEKTLLILGLTLFCFLKKTIRVSVFLLVKVTINFEANYYSPDGRIGNWTNRDNTDFVFPIIDDYSADVIDGANVYKE